MGQAACRCDVARPPRCRAPRGPARPKAEVHRGTSPAEQFGHGLARGLRRAVQPSVPPAFKTALPTRVWPIKGMLVGVNPAGAGPSSTALHRVAAFFGRAGVAQAGKISAIRRDSMSGSGHGVHGLSRLMSKPPICSMVRATRSRRCPGLRWRRRSAVVDGGDHGRAFGRSGKVAL